jgi:protein TilB
MVLYKLGIKKPRPQPVYNDKGEIRQCNQAGYEYSFYEKIEKDRQFIVLEVGVPKYLDTSNIDVDLNPTYVRLTIKGKVLQLSFPCEILVDDSQAKRSQTTGSLQLVMPKLKNSLVPYFFYKEEIEERKQKEKKIHKANDELKSTETGTQESGLEIEERTLNDRKNESDAWVDDPDVPPLE